MPEMKSMELKSPKVGKRIDWVDICKFVAIFFVIVHHLSCRSEAFDSFFEPFTLEVFLFLAGYVHRDRGSFREHLKYKVKTLLLPWFLFTNLNLLLSVVFSFEKGRNMLHEFLMNLLQIHGFHDELWFLAALFVAQLPFYFVIRKNKPVLMTALLAVLAVGWSVYSRCFPGELLPWGTTALPWHLEYICYAMFYMTLGYYFKRTVEPKLDEHNSLGFILGIWAVYLAVDYLLKDDTAFSFVAMDYVRGLIGTAAVIMTCKKIKTNRYISFVGANTLLCFAFHGKALGVIVFVLEKKFGDFYSYALSTPVLCDVLSALIAFAVTLVLIIPIKIINRWFPWTIGHKRRPTTVK